MNIEQLQEGLREVARDLFNLEINTILKDNMTARKMPDPANALLDIAQAYAAKLNRHKASLDFFFDRDQEQQLKDERPPADAPFTKFSNSRLTINILTFSRLRWAAVATLDANTQLPDTTRIILERIRRNCDQLKNLLSRYSDDSNYAAIQGMNRSQVNDHIGKKKSKALLDLHPDDLTLLRKIWEVGTEVVVMQTVIQLDGDVINRVQKSYATPDHKYILDIHGRNVDHSVGFWKVVAETVATFFGSFPRLFTRGT